MTGGNKIHRRTQHQRQPKRTRRPLHHKAIGSTALSGIRALSGRTALSEIRTLSGRTALSEIRTLSGKTTRPKRTAIIRCQKRCAQRAGDIARWQSVRQQNDELAFIQPLPRSEERRVGKENRSGEAGYS